MAEEKKTTTKKSSGTSGTKSAASKSTSTKSAGAKTTTKSTTTKKATTVKPKTNKVEKVEIKPEVKEVQPEIIESKPEQLAPVVTKTTNSGFGKFSKGLIAGAMALSMGFGIAGMALAITKQGKPGKTAYELAVENGFTGSLQDWLNSLKGQNGINGENGINGKTWFSGIGEPSQTMGVVGDFYMDEFNHVIYEKQATGWVYITQVSESEKTYFYYANVATAINAINNNGLNDETLRTEKESAQAAVYLENNVPTVVLLNNTTLAEKVTISKSMVLSLQGKTLNFTCGTGLEIVNGTTTIKGDVAGSKITITSETESSTAIKVTAGKCFVYGGEYVANSNGLGTFEVPNAAVYVENLATLNMTNVKVAIADETNGTACGLLVKKGGRVEVNNSSFEAVSPFGLNVTALLNEGEGNFTDSTFIAKSNYTANEAKTDYATNSRGVYNFGLLNMKDCVVKGTHSGMTTKGVVNVDGGSYEGYSHGGIYFGGGHTKSYVKNATLKQIEMFEGFYDDGIAGTNQAGMYVGGADYIVVYMDNCKFIGNYYPFVMKKGCSNCALYVSNSTVVEGFTKYIRLDTTNNKLYIGAGNNFTIETCYQEGAAIETNVDYLINFEQV